MYNATDKSYRQARAIKTGAHKLATVHQAFVDWISKQFNVSVLDFTCEMKETSKGFRQQVLYVIVERIEEANRLDVDLACEAKISQAFIGYLASRDADTRDLDPLKSKVFSLNTDPYPEILVAYRPLEEVEMKVADERIESECHALLRKHGDVWTMSDKVIFYYTDQQVAENNVNGEAEKLLNEILQLLKKYDEFGYFGMHSISYRFDSKETFDRDYHGNWYHYWK